MKYGKIIEGQLQIAGNTIKTDKGTITNPTDEMFIELGYKEIVYTEKPEFDKENEKLSEVYTDGENITVSYEKVSLSPAEHNAIIKQEIVEEESKITPRRQREIDLNKKGALEFAQQIEDNITALRAKLQPEPKEEDNGNID
jgi:hypothetical protein